MPHIRSQVVLRLSPLQVDVLLSRIETAFVMAQGINPERGIALARSALLAPPHADSFDAAQLAPAYAQLLQFSPRGGLAAAGMAGEGQVRWARRNRPLLRRLAAGL